MSWLLVTQVAYLHCQGYHASFPAAMVFVVITEAAQDFSFLQARGTLPDSGEKKGRAKGVAEKAWELCLPMPSIGPASTLCALGCAHQLFRCQAQSRGVPDALA